MAEILLFHHVLGLSPGVQEFAHRLRAAGHTVNTPDLFDGRTFTELEDGIDHVRSIGFGTVLERGVAEAVTLPTDLVYAGFSLGVMPAQKLAQTRPGARGALFFEACLPVEEFGTAWPQGVPVQVHGMDSDPSFAGEGDLEAARALIASAPQGELFLYEGSTHLFSDSWLPGYDEDAATLMTGRVLDFLSRCD